MRDQIDAEIWNANHDQFSEWIGAALGQARAALDKGLARSSPAAAQLLAAAFAVSLSLLTVTATVA